jgi:hypothetical protein
VPPLPPSPPAAAAVAAAAGVSFAAAPLVGRCTPPSSRALHGLERVAGPVRRRMWTRRSSRPRIPILLLLPAVQLPTSPSPPQPVPILVVWVGSVPRHIDKGVGIERAVDGLWMGA